LGLGSYPADNGSIWDNFGLGWTNNQTHVVTTNVSNILLKPHLYNVMTKAGNSANSWISWLNGSQILATNNVKVDFGAGHMIGKTSDNQGFWGYMGEIMIFNRELTAEEKDAVNSYLNKRYKLY